MINDNKQSQRGSPLQRGPLLEPVPQTPNQPYNPLPPAGGGTVFTPGRTVFGRDYATPQESPLATLLGELPTVVKAVGATVEQVKKWKQEDQENLVNQTQEEILNKYKDLSAKYPDGKIPREVLQNFHKEVVNSWASLDSSITNSKVRSKYLGSYLEARNAYSNTTQAIESMSTEELLSESVLNSQRAASGDINALAQAANVSKTAIAHLEAEREELIKNGTNSSRLREVTNLIATEQNRRVQTAVDYAEKDLGRIAMKNPTDAEERTNDTLEYIDGLKTELMEKAGYTETEANAVGDRLVSTYLQQANSRVELRKQRAFTSFKNSIESIASDKDEDGSTLLTSTVDTIFTQAFGNDPSTIIDALTNGYDQLTNDVKLAVLESAGISLDSQSLIEVNYSKDEAEILMRGLETSLHTSIEKELDNRRLEYQSKELQRVESEYQTTLSNLSQLNYEDFLNQGVNAQSLVAQRMELNNLLPPDRQMSHRQVLDSVKEDIIRSLTSNPAVVQAISGNQLDSQKFRRVFAEMLGFTEEVLDSGDPSVTGVIPGSWAAGMLKDLRKSNTDSSINEENILERLLVPQISAITQQMFKEVARETDAAVESARLMATDPQKFGQQDLDSIVNGLIAFAFKNPGAVPNERLPLHLRGAKTLEEALTRQRQFAQSNNFPIDMSDPTAVDFLMLTSGIPSANLIQRAGVQSVAQSQIESLNQIEQDSYRGLGYEATPVVFNQLQQMHIDLYGEPFDEGYMRQRDAIPFLTRKLKREIQKRADEEAGLLAPQRTISLGTEATAGLPKAVFDPLFGNYVPHLERFLAAEDPETERQSFRIIRSMFRLLQGSLGSANPETLDRVYEAMGEDPEKRKLINTVLPMISGTDTVLSAVISDPTTLRNYLELRRESSGRLDADLEAVTSMTLNNLPGPTEIWARNVPTLEDIKALLTLSRENGGLGIKVEDVNMLNIAVAVNLLASSPFADRIKREGFDKSIVTLYELLENRNINVLDYAARRAAGSLTTSGLLYAIGADISKDFDLAYNEDLGVVAMPASTMWVDNKRVQSNTQSQTPLSMAQGRYNDFRNRYGLGRNVTDSQVATSALWVSKLSDTKDPETTRTAMVAWATHWIDDIMAGVVTLPSAMDMKNGTSLAERIRAELQGHVDAVFSREDFMDLTFAEITEDILKRWEPAVFRKHATFVFSRLGYTIPYQETLDITRLDLVPTWNRNQPRAFTAPPLTDETREMARRGFSPVGVSILGDRSFENSHGNRLYRLGYYVPNVLIDPNKADDSYLYKQRFTVPRGVGNIPFVSQWVRDAPLIRQFTGAKNVLP